MTSHHKTGTHPFLWQAGIRPALIHFYDKPASYRYSSIFMTSQHNAGTHPFLWQASIMPVLIHFYDKPALCRYLSILHRYVYTHIYTYLCTYIYTSQKECLHIFHTHAHPHTLGNARVALPLWVLGFYGSTWKREGTLLSTWSQSCSCTTSRQKGST